MRHHLKSYATCFWKEIPLLLIWNLQEEIEFVTIVFIFFSYNWVIYFIQIFVL